MDGWSIPYPLNIELNEIASGIESNRDLVNELNRFRKLPMISSPIQWGIDHSLLLRSAINFPPSDCGWVWNIKTQERVLLCLQTKLSKLQSKAVFLSLFGWIINPIAMSWTKVSVIARYSQRFIICLYSFLRLYKAFYHLLADCCHNSALLSPT